MQAANDVMRVEGDKVTFAEFYRIEQARQVRRAALMLGSSEQANDVVQDAFVELYRRWATLDNPGPYLNTVVLNRCRDAARGRRRSHGLLVRLAGGDQSAPEPDHVADLLAGLPFNQRAAVVLRYFVGLQNHEIAEVMQCAPGSVGPWLERALRRLRKDLE